MMHMPKPWVTQARAWGRELRPYGRTLTVQVGTGQQAGKLLGDSGWALREASAIHPGELGPQGP